MGLCQPQPASVGGLVGPSFTSLEGVVYLDATLQRYSETPWDPGTTKKAGHTIPRLEWTFS